MALQAFVCHIVKPFCKILLASSPADLLAWPHSIELGWGLCEDGWVEWKSVRLLDNG
jgi:hypothetical protein